jgi:L,D-peptidoglycan transpeptidase YkuD (ErfK/YbiS/YcfS/YnhG family)
MAFWHDRLSGNIRSGRGRAAAGGLVALVAASVAACGSPSRHTTVVATTIAPSTTATTVAPTTTATTRPAPTSTTTRMLPPTTVAPVSITARSQAPAGTTAACERNLASTLASTAGARQLITVEASSAATTVASVELWQRAGTCWEAAGGPWTGFVGYNGFSDHKREGDGTTPTGLYGIGPVMYGNAPNPGVRYAYQDLVCGDWWDENPASAEYNTFQRAPCSEANPFGGDSEALWTETAPYPSFAVVEYNTDPVISGAGSAIFLHASTGGPTSGCVSVPLADLDQLLRWLNPGDSPVIAMGPSSEMARF